jgi:hypothetical protein
VTEPDPHEPHLICVRHLDIRRTDNDLPGFVARIVDELESGTTLVDISPHDSRSGTIRMLVPEPRP